MRPLLLLFCALASFSAAESRTITVSTAVAPSTLRAAAQMAEPGDTIRFEPGVYAGGEYVERLQGRADAWITIVAGGPGEVVLRGGGNAWHLVDPAYLRIEGFFIEEQTGNGMNIDDGGSYETPAHHLEISRCTWRGIAALGNNDQLKLSGLDSFVVRDCVFLDGSPGGSMIDMVGCHAGLFVGNRFERAGSNAIQAKGGTQWIAIERNTFLDGGARAINIGGSTDTLYFRPKDATFEASHIAVHANLFIASDAPLAFVGAVNCEAVNNTIIAPRRWAFRILQETTLPRFQQCGENALRNNIVVLGTAAAGYTVNVGPNTRPATFAMERNLWFNADNPSWLGPSLPVTETGSIIADPQLNAPPTDITLRAGSPAIAAGAATVRPELDLYGRRYAVPRSIGAAEVVGTTRATNDDDVHTTTIGWRGSSIVVTCAAASASPRRAYVVDARGAMLGSSPIGLAAGASVELPVTAPGPYFVVIYDARGPIVYRLAHASR